MAVSGWIRQAPLRTALGIPASIRYGRWSMSEMQEDSPLDRLWKEYARTFRHFDDLTLARWCSQTLGQLHG